MAKQRLGRRITFGPFTLFPEACELRKFDICLTTAGQCIAFLATLTQNAPELVSKKDLERVLWPNGESHVENCLNVVASAAWRALGDTDHSRKYFVSHGRDGYRFIHPIDCIESEDRYQRRGQAENAYREAMLGLENRYEQSLRECVLKFKEAIKNDPSHAQAWTGLAVAHIMLGIHCADAPGDAFPKAEAAARQALQINPSLLHARICLAWVALCYERKWKQAEEILRSALKKNRQDPLLHNAMALLNIALNRVDEAVSSLVRARRLNAISPSLNALVCNSLYLSRRYTEAVIAGMKAVVSEPQSCLAHSCLSLALFGNGDWEKAHFHAAKAVELSHGSNVYVGFRAYLCTRTGREREARDTLEAFLRTPEHIYSPSYFIALIHLGRGNERLCLKWLAQACQERSHWVLFMNADPIFDPIRENPRFRELLQAAGLPYQSSTKKPSVLSRSKVQESMTTA